MDFHAYFEVFLGHHWSVFDARFNVPRIGRIKVAHGLDAVDGAFSTIYGAAQLKWFEVWALPGQSEAGHAGRSDRHVEAPGRHAGSPLRVTPTLL